MSASNFYMYNDPAIILKQASSDFLETARIVQRNIGEDEASVQFVFVHDFVYNSILVIARSYIDLLLNEGIKVTMLKKSSSSFNYANRMGFFEGFDEITYDLDKQSANGRFLEIETISSNDNKVTVRIQEQLRKLSERDETFISDEALELLTYSVGEVVSNVRRHAGTIGRISYQHYVDFNQITISDCGNGIINHMRGAGYTGTDVEILLKSISEFVSSSHKNVHGYGEKSPGVGLYNLTRIAELNSNTSVRIVTNNVELLINKEHTRDNPKINIHQHFFIGTIVQVQIPNEIQVTLEEIMAVRVENNKGFF